MSNKFQFHSRKKSGEVKTQLEKKKHFKKHSGISCLKKLLVWESAHAVALYCLEVGESK